ncbi:hypothetical protein ACFQU7_07475 [Pseudoroseomonas wenyumeiae]
MVVVKVEFEAVEDTWRDSDRPIYVTDRRGIVLLTNRSRWRFQTDHPLPPQDLAAIRDSLQFGTAPLAPLPLRPNPLGFDASAVLLDEEPAATAAGNPSSPRPSRCCRPRCRCPARTGNCTCWCPASPCCPPRKRSGAMPCSASPWC